MQGFDHRTRCSLVVIMDPVVCSADAGALGLVIKLIHALKGLGTVCGEADERLWGGLSQ